MKRNVWEEIADIYDLYIIDSENTFLRAFLEAEQNLLDRTILHMIRQGRKVSLIEVGTGTGRTLFSYATRADILEKMEYLIGIDNARAMCNIAKFKLAELRKQGILSDADANKFFFLEMHAERLSRYFSQGKLLMDRRTATIGYGGERNTLDKQKYAASAKIVCNLLNTQGCMRGQSSIEVIQNMVRALGPGDRLIVSVFDAQYFSENARALYATLRPLVGDYDEMAFNDRSHVFETANYYSHWFTEEEITQLLKQAGYIEISVERFEPGGLFLHSGGSTGGASKSNAEVNNNY